jgi:hypothetical protein
MDIGNKVLGPFSSGSDEGGCRMAAHSRDEAPTEVIEANQTQLRVSLQLGVNAPGNYENSHG